MTTPTRTAAAAAALALVALCTSAAQAAPIGVYNSHFVTGSDAAAAPGDGRAASYQCNTQAYVGDLAGCSNNGTRLAEGGASVSSGTVSNSGAITAFQAQTRANEFRFEYPNNERTVVVGPGFSQATASANLAEASLRASVTNNANQGFVAGSAQADLHDIVRLQVAGATASTVTRVQFRYAVDGTVFDDLQTTVFGERGSGNLRTVLRLDDLSSAHENTPDYWLTAVGGWEFFRGALTSNSSSVDVRGQRVGGSWTTFGLEEMIFDGWMDIFGTEATINPTLSLSLDCGIGLQCDYGNTARFSFVGLPSSVSYTSSSGVFLTAGMQGPGTAVPEPASLLLALAGLGALGFVRRRSA